MFSSTGSKFSATENKDSKFRWLQKWVSPVNFTASFNNIHTLNFKTQLTIAFFAPVDQNYVINQKRVPCDLLNLMNITFFKDFAVITNDSDNANAARILNFRVWNIEGDHNFKLHFVFNTNLFPQSIFVMAILLISSIWS